MKKLLKVEDLTAGYGKRAITRGVSFEIGKGECLMLMGPNGAGKTTTLRAILGLADKLSGKVEFFTDNIFFLPAKSNVNREAMPPLTIKDFFELDGTEEKLTRGLMEEVGLGTVGFDEEIVNLSTGQFQRLLVAWALAKDPELLILDEPTSGVDAAGEKSLYDVIGKRIQQGMGVIVVTHDLDLIWQRATRVVCLGNGHYCYGRPQEVLTAETLEKLYGRKLSLFHAHER